MNKLQPLIEGFLFLSGDKGMTIGELVTYVGLDQMTIENKLEEMKTQYLQNQNSAFTIVYTASTYKLSTKPEFSEKFKIYADSEFNDIIPKSSLETLAIIAYNQPITKFDIEQIKGVSPSHTVSVLLERDLIQVVGRSHDIGRPKLYGITDITLDYLGINSVDDLPPLKEYTVDFDEEQTELFNSEIDFKEIRKRLLKDLEFEQSILEYEEEDVQVPDLKLHIEEGEEDGTNSENNSK